jgi:casein kinase II subunit beta
MDEPIEAYNSDSGDGDFQMEDMSDEAAGGRQGNNDNEETTTTMGWIQWFCSLEGHEYMVEVDDAYIRDPFNLYGLQSQMTQLSKEKFKQCIKMILSPQSPNEEDLADEQFLELNQEASDLYGLIHARYINSACGMAKVYHKFLSSLYGTCPRALCDRQKVLPVGLSDQLKVSRFKVYCPRCEEVYIPKFRSVNIDGAFFGTTFPHHFLKHQKQAVILPPKIYHYEPKIYGFKIEGKRGSKYFEPPLGNIKYNWDSMTAVDKEKLIAKGQDPRSNRFSNAGPFSGEVQSQTQKAINSNFFVTETKDAEQVIAEALKKQPIQN